jgi:PQQ-dependent catabolism-associated CXXCW motif protein
MTFKRAGAAPAAPHSLPTSPRWPHWAGRCVFQARAWALGLLIAVVVGLAGRAAAPALADDAVQAPVSPANIAHDLEVPEPEDYRTNDYRMPVPKTLKGARVITPDEAEKMLAEKSAVFIDVYPRAPKPPNLPAGTVWRDPPHSTIDGTHWLPNVGYGVLSPEFETYFKSRLETLTGNDPSTPVVFFCLKDCWMSWNAAKRAISWGYSAVAWFPEGTDGWQAIGNDLVAAKPVE